MFYQIKNIILPIFGKNFLATKILFLDFCYTFITIISFRKQKLGDYMKYNIKILSEKYAKFLEEHEIDLTSPPQAFFQESAYNDLEYIDCVKFIQEDFDNVDDLFIYEKFLKGE